MRSWGGKPGLSLLRCCFYLAAGAFCLLAVSVAGPTAFAGMSFQQQLMLYMLIQKQQEQQQQQQQQLQQQQQEQQNALQQQQQQQQQQAAAMMDSAKNLQLKVPEQAQQAQKQSVASLAGGLAGALPGFGSSIPQALQGAVLSKNGEQSPQADLLKGLNSEIAAAVSAVQCAEAANQYKKDSPSFGPLALACQKGLNAANFMKIGELREGNGEPNSKLKASEAILNSAGGTAILNDFERNFGMPKEEFVQAIVNTRGREGGLSEFLGDKLPWSKLDPALQAAKALPLAETERVLNDSRVDALDGSGASTSTAYQRRAGGGSASLRDRLQEAFSSDRDGGSMAPMAGGGEIVISSAPKPRASTASVFEGLTPISEAESPVFAGPDMSGLSFEKPATGRAPSKGGTLEVAEVSGGMQASRAGSPPSRALASSAIALKETGELTIFDVIHRKYQDKARSLTSAGGAAGI